MISSNKLYEANIIDELDEDINSNGGRSPNKKSSKKDFLGWMHQFNENSSK